jgi:CheY-like chemotaxis protein
VLTPQVLDLNQVITEVHKLLSRVIGEDIRIEVASAVNLDRVKADPGQIEQVIINLAVNARDAMPQGGFLRIATANVTLDSEFAKQRDGAMPGRYVALTMQDNGCGMTAEVLSHVFEPFFTTKPTGKGTGLGLATVYGIVRQSGGYITIDSVPGAGTKVTIYLPAANESSKAPEASPATSEVVGGTETILLVEDEVGIRDLMHRTLQRLGYNVLTAQSVTHAVSIAQSHKAPIELLLSDVVMPGLSGPDLAQRIVRLQPTIKVLYVSGFPHHISSESGSVSPRAAFLSKPFTPQTLARKVRECLDTRF